MLFIGLIGLIVIRTSSCGPGLFLATLRCSPCSWR